MENIMQELGGCLWFDNIVYANFVDLIMQSESQVVDKVLSSYENDEEEYNCFGGDEENQDFVEDEGEDGKQDDEQINDAIAQKRGEGIVGPDENDELCPFVGMEFATQDEAHVFYIRYARKMGFSTRKHSTSKSQRTGKVIGRCFCCSHQGYSNSKTIRVEDKKKPRPESRTGCKAMMWIRRKKGDRWVVSQIIKEHNHVLASPSTRNNPHPHRIITEDQGEVVQNMHSCGLRTNLMMNFMHLETGGSHHVDFTLRETRNFLSKRRQRELPKGDIEIILDYFDCQRTKNPLFFYSIQVDSDGQMTNFFWADARSRMDCHLFGDVVCVDPTYGTSRYNMPFVPVVGINHHHQTMLFGAALLFDGTEESFVWLLETFMRAIGGQHPKVIFTDQESAIGGAINRVFPGTHHRFCLWNIMGNAANYMPRIFNAHSGFARDFENCLCGGETDEEFESKWEGMLLRYGLRGNIWLMRLYEKREKWAWIYTRDIFCASMYTTHHIESINAYFDRYLKRNMPLSEFLKHYDKAVIARRKVEDDEDLETNHKKPVLRVGMDIEEEAAKVYTRTIFRKFQEELVQGLNYRHEKIEENGPNFTYGVWKREQEQARCIVTFDISHSNAKCSCQLFERAGYLCRHILKIFLVADVHNIPTQYILKRWMRDVKSEPLVNDQGEEVRFGCYNLMSIRYSNLYCEVLNIASKAAVTDEVYRIAVNGLHTALQEVEIALQKVSLGPIEHSKEIESTHENIGQGPQNVRVTSWIGNWPELDNV
ncbi:protein FAR1-RELATED SEQUENCE 5-like [Telopea speciosissima]|uniref:protein FAR1-RELATED SEQUENCE 5-like n=1 Tax=Telopea speciosissima TaxID=54955 RepID=UPI001CC5A5B2|nr:protein FAR1-RELATED SEQUENCE 5-like [Telopea speciosissima]